MASTTISGTFTGSVSGTSNHARVTITMASGKQRTIDADGSQWATDNEERDSAGAACVRAVLSGSTSGTFSTTAA